VCASNRAPCSRPRPGSGANRRRRGPPPWRDGIPCEAERRPSRIQTQRWMKMSGTSPKPSLRLLAIGVASGLLLAGCSSEAPSAREAADVLIRGGTVYDGGSGEAVAADVVIAGDRIAYVGADAERRYAAERVIDAAGKVVAPGFIDPHTHPGTY